MFEFISEELSKWFSAKNKAIVDICAVALPTGWTDAENFDFYPLVSASLPSIKKNNYMREIFQEYLYIISHKQVDFILKRTIEYSIINWLHFHNYIDLVKTKHGLVFKINSGLLPGNTDK